MVIDKRIVSLLQQRLANEWYSVGFYTYLANWCSFKGYMRASEYFKNYANTEYMHMSKVTGYLIDGGVMPDTADTNGSYPELDNLEDVIGAWMEAQNGATMNVMAICDKAKEIGDGVTYQFFSWFIEDQRKNEAEVQSMIDWCENIGLINSDAPDWAKGMMRAELDEMFEDKLEAVSEAV